MIQRGGDPVAAAGSNDQTNVDAACFTIPSLSTVHRPLYEMGRAAASTVVAAAEGRPIERHIEIPTRLVVRESCGGATTPAGLVGWRGDAAAHDTDGHD